jgi:hypothetical protein
MTIPRTLAVRIVLASIAVFLLLAVLSSAAKRPRTDEAHMASGPVNLVRTGEMGTTVFETANSSYLRLERYSYWQMPLNLLFQAGWYQLFGVELFRARLLPVLFGALLIWVLWRLMLTVTGGDHTIAALAAALLALNYEMTMVASDTRPDMVCALGNFAAFAVYLAWRESNLPRAILLSTTLTAMALFCHPNGVLGALGLALLYLWFDRTRFAFSHLLLAGLPYVAGLALWGIYIVQDVEAFRMQFFYNAQDDGRLRMLLQPWLGIWREITEKYLGLFAGFHPTAPKVLRVKVFALALIVAAVVSLFVAGPVRRVAGARVIGVLTLLYFLVLGLFDGQKQYIYLVHMVPLFSAAIAIAVVSAVRYRPSWKLLAMLVLAGYSALQVGGTLYRIREQSWNRLYQPAVNYIVEHGKPDSSIFAPGEFAWGFDFNARMIDDLRLGFYSHRRAEWVIVDARWRELWENYRRRQPELFTYLETSLRETYVQVHETGGYEIYRRRDAGTR